MVLGHPDIERGRDQYIAAVPVRLVRNDLGAQPVRAEKARRPVLFIGADWNDHRPGLSEPILDFRPSR
jgi:hypothetical protein